MSWCRWGSPCWNTAAPQYVVDVACTVCPGSDVYVYDGGRLTCCSCRFGPDDLENGGHFDFECDTEAEMYAHLLAHDAAGHHVRKSLLARARGEEPEVTAFWKELCERWKAFNKMGAEPMSCSRCGGPLAEGTYREMNGVVICHACCNEFGAPGAYIGKTPNTQWFSGSCEIKPEAWREFYKAMQVRYSEPEVASSRGHARRLARRYGRTGKKGFHIPERWRGAYEAEARRSGLFVRLVGAGAGASVPKCLVRVGP
jgi:hypothetical protein